ncbi:MAG: phage gp6-like head-tail connector protein, partial [Bacteroidales bacterium]|nr:phage gp6-like head-tail connector protein [Bacteroidales bacterium]
NVPSVDKMLEAYGGTMPAPLVHAALMLVDTWYQFRTPDDRQTLSVVPYSFDILVKPYVKL